MIVSELIKELQKLDGSVRVMVYTDHGQSGEDASTVEFISISEGDPLHPDDVKGGEEKVVMIFGQ